jgi:hypothetical protein
MSASLFGFISAFGVAVALPEFGASDELSVWDRYLNLTSDSCPNLGVNGTSQCRDSYTERHLCRVEAARRVWDTPCYAQSWQNCVRRTPNIQRAVLPATQGPASKCTWCSVSQAQPEAAYSCTNGAAEFYFFRDL